jgi:acyl-CoA synthetase (AMP-forming)/AMP-acid ligase II
MKGAAATRVGLSKLGAQAALYDLYGHQLSGHDLLKSVDQLAGALVEEGLLGRTIGLWYRNSFEAVQAFLAVEWIGGTRVTVDPRAPVGEVTAVLTAAGVDAVLTDRDYSFDGKPVFKHTDSSTVRGKALFPDLEVDPGKTFVVYPRAVEEEKLFAISISYGNWAAIMQTNIDLYRGGRYGPWREDAECFLANQQIMHGTGFVGTFPFLRMGLPQVLVDTFDENKIIDAIVRRKVTATLFVPLMLARVTTAAANRQQDVSSLRHVLYGGGRTRREEIVRAYENLSPHLTQIYGRLEGGWPISILDPDDHRAIAQGASELADSCGRPVAAVETKIRPVSSSKEPATGELCTRGPMAVAEHLDAEGWCASGDIMKVDQGGYLYYKGRADRMINNGFHVYPEEIERAILVVEGVAAARVYGKSDPSYGEIVAADLVLMENFEFGDVLRRVRYTLESSLAKYKVPKIFNPVDSITSLK